MEMERRRYVMHTTGNSCCYYVHDLEGGGGGGIHDIFEFPMEGSADTLEGNVTDGKAFVKTAAATRLS